jgi:hypothetical protein
MDKLLIFYLTNNDRYFVFEKFIHELQQVKRIDDILLLIVNSSKDSTRYEEYLSKTSIHYMCRTIDCPKENYLPKVAYAIEFAKQNGFKYMMKCDNDIIIPTYTFDYFTENLHLLDTNLTLSPLLSTGIPSVEYFIDSFLSEDEALEIRKEFKKCMFFEQRGIFDYRPLNYCTLKAKTWNYKSYFEKLKELSEALKPINHSGRTELGHNKYYMGIHPIRHGFGNSQINDYIVKYKERFFSEKECSILDESFPYLCDMCFLISTNHYDNLISRDDLIIDGCDEVPLNRYACNNNLKHLIVKDGYAIHITYNWRWSLNNESGGSNIDKPTEDILTYEEKFINNLYTT